MTRKIDHMYAVVLSTEMRRNIKRVAKRGKNMSKLTAVLDLIATGELLPPRYRDHALTGNWRGRRECHIEPDWLLVYQIFDDKLILLATGTGTHSDLFP